MTKLDGSLGYIDKFDRRGDFESPKGHQNNSDLLNVQSSDNELSRGTNTNPKNTRGITPPPQI